MSKVITGGFLVKLRQAIVGCYVILFCVFALAALLVPDQLANLMDNRLTSNAEKVEFVATYCGLFVGLGLFLLYCLVNNVHMGLVAVMFTMGGMFIFRAVGSYLYNTDNLVQYIYLQN